jgi:ribosomal protein S4
MVNGHRLNVPSALTVNEGDSIAVREASLKKEYFKKLLKISNPELSLFG